MTRKLTDEQVKMLIEDGTLDKAIELAEQSKCQEPKTEVDRLSDFVDEFVAEASKNQRHLFKLNGFFDKYEYISNMFTLNAQAFQPQDEKSLYIYRNFVMAQYKDYARNMLDEMEQAICSDMHIPYIFQNYDHFESKLSVQLLKNLCDLNYMNYFGTSFDTSVLYSYAHSLLTYFAYKYNTSKRIPMPTDILEMENDSDIDHAYDITLNPAITAHRYFDDVCAVIFHIVDFASTCLCAIANNYNKKVINPDVANNICMPAPYDLTEPMTTYDNAHPALRNFDDEPYEVLRKKPLFTIVSMNN